MFGASPRIVNKQRDTSAVLKDCFDLSLLPIVKLFDVDEYKKKNTVVSSFVLERNLILVDLLLANPLSGSQHETTGQIADPVIDSGPRSNSVGE